jgi:perosamine synthetase
MIDRIGDLERRYVEEVLSGAFHSSVGSVMTSRLERAFAEVIGTRYAIAFINGTATMHAVLAAQGVGPGDEVIVPPLTMSSTAFAVAHAGALPVFADVSASTWTLDPDCVANAVTDRTKAVIPVGIYGLPPDLGAIMAIAERHGLFVLEDDAQCFLARYDGRMAGSIGQAASFSLQSSKHLTSGEGGLVTTDDEDLADRVRRFGSLGYRAVAAGQAKITKQDIQDPDYLRHGSIGFNYRMPELCAAVALAQVERSEELVGARVAASAAMAEAVVGCSWLHPQRVPADRTHTYWSYALALDPRTDVSWQDFRARFRQHGGDGFYGCWALSYLEPALRGRRLSEAQTQAFEPDLCPVAESLQPRLMQFKTDYFDVAAADRQAASLRRTIDYFDPRHA